MHTQTDEFASHIGAASSANEDFLDTDTLRNRAPAVYAASAHEATSRTYAFLSTQKLLNSLSQAGFLPVAAEQSATRVRSALHARHVIRLRRRFETIELSDGFPELVLLNSHDGTSAYLRWILQCHHRSQNTSIARVSRYQSRTRHSIEGW
jgi:hypothetical protein